MTGLAADSDGGPDVPGQLLVTDLALLDIQWLRTAKLINQPIRFSGTSLWQEICLTVYLAERGNHLPDPDRPWSWTFSAEDMTVAIYQKPAPEDSLERSDEPAFQATPAKPFGMLEHQSEPGIGRLLWPEYDLDTHLHSDGTACHLCGLANTVGRISGKRPPTS